MKAQQTNESTSQRILNVTNEFSEFFGPLTMDHAAWIHDPTTDSRLKTLGTTNFHRDNERFSPVPSVSL